MRQAWVRFVRGCAISIAVSAVVVEYIELTGQQFAARPALFVGILLAAWFGGVRAGLIGTISTALVVIYTLTPDEQFKVRSGDIEPLLTFVLTGLALNAFIIWRRRSESALIQTQGQLAGLQESAADLLEARNPNEVATTSVQEASRALGACAGLVAAHADHSPQFTLLGASGFAVETLEALRISSPHIATPVADAFFLQRPLLIGSAAELARLYPQFAEASLSQAFEGFASIPLTVRGRRHGVLVLCFPKRTKFAKSRLDLLMTFANQAAQAFDRADLVTSVSRQSHAFQVVSEASLAFSELDVESTAIVRKLADLCVERLADWVVAYGFSRDGRFLDPLAVRDREPEVQRIWESALSRERFLVGTGISGVVGERGSPKFLPRTPAGAVPEAALRHELAPSPADASYSVLSVPIAAHGETLGVLTLGRPGSRVFEQAHIDITQEVARRAGLALWAANQREQAQREIELRRRVEDDLREYQGKLQQALAAKDEFLGLVSHELRTPLTTIRGNADILRRRLNLTEDQRAQAMADIHVESERLSRIIENMLYLARLEAGKRPVLEPVLLDGVVRRASDDFLRKTHEADVRLGPMDSGIIVEANEAYVEQILQNLLSNALKYSRPGAPIEVAVRGCNGDAVVCVADRGIGIRQLNSAQLFEPYYRENQQSPYASGLGIGLAVCKRLVEAQGGTIRAQPREGGGSAFSFTLPLWQEG